MPVDASQRRDAVITLPFSGGDEKEIAAAVLDHGLDFTRDEAIRLAELLGRDPTVLEAHLFNTMWSEHCSYKSSKPLLKEHLPTDSPFVVLGPVEDAGVVEIGTHEGVKWAVALGHESHNHPSQIVPYEGAATGIGGIVRDVYCMGADVFAVLDSLRFGDLEGPKAERSREIMQGVIDGIAGYGNPLGIPNLGGETTFHPGYDDNCLVNVICAGSLRVDRLIHSAVPPEAKDEPYDLILVGKGTDASGFGGAAMASRILDLEEDRRGAVQVPDPFLKRVIRNATLEVAERAATRGIAVGFKDLGAGGIACVASEIAHSGGVGVEMDLDLVHVIEENLPPEVIACAETQERFGWAVPRTFTEEVLAIYNDEYELGRVSRGAAASVIGHFLPDEEVMRVLWNGEIAGEAKTDDITAGVVADRKAAPPRPGTHCAGDGAAAGSAGAARTEVQGPAKIASPEFRELALAVLGSPNIASKRELFSHYDQEVQGRTFYRPGEADAGVALPVDGSPLGVLLSSDGNPRYGELDPYWGGANAVVEAVRNVVVTGGWPRALTDCLNFGNPENPEVYRDFRDAIIGLSEAARGIGTLELEDGSPLPFISGNVSLYNESSAGSAVPPSPIVCCLGVQADATRTVGARLKEPGNVLVLVGDRRVELGGSEAAWILAGKDAELRKRGQVPTADFAAERIYARGVLAAIESGRVLSGHDISSGGLLVALAEMMLGARGTIELGLDVNVSKLPGNNDFERLFSETGAYLLEMDDSDVASLGDLPHRVLGTVMDSPELVIRGSSGALRLAGADLTEAWAESFARVLE